MWFLKYCMMTCVTIWNFCLTQGIVIFQMACVWCHVIRGQSSIPSVSRPMKFHVTEYEKWIDTLSGSTLQLSFKKRPLVRFWFVSKMNTHNYPKILLHFPNTFLYEAEFSLYAVTTKTDHDRLNAEVDRSDLCSIKPNVKEICKNEKKKAPPFFCLGKHNCFSQKC